MKNIHVILTDKPSELGKFIDTNNLVLRTYNDIPRGENVHIYITNDEDIKEGDWCYYLNQLGGGNIICQAYKHKLYDRMLFDSGKHNRELGEGITPLKGECKKIILTTDEDLIVNTVQSIDDEFLEWFVNNPSCEEVEINILNKGYNKTKDIPYQEFYKIIIPIEESKQETIEEAINKYFRLSHSRLINEQKKEYERELFIAGAEYMQKQMYSEDEVRKLLQVQRGNCYVAILTKTRNTELALLASSAPEPSGKDGWVERFKKK
jgi:hypothetical protein